MSVMAFLEIVEEYRMSRGCTEADMMASVIDLVEGSAKICYNKVKSKINSWAYFKSYIKQEFSPLGYEKQPNVYELLDFQTRCSLGDWHVKDIKTESH
ncbi:hypothetical protein JTB14_023902 [Gonioctena quinquepunctata]|nr:hypothetical protein JTB14_023902 [Gonioctena quinquepunctata]